MNAENSYRTVNFATTRIKVASTKRAQILLELNNDKMNKDLFNIMFCRGQRARQQLAELRSNPLILSLNNNDVGKKKLGFDINKVHTISLNQFDLNDPASLAQFALGTDDVSDSDNEFTDISEDDEDDVFDESGAGKSELDLDATFILENTKLKLIERQFTVLLH